MDMRSVDMDRPEGLSGLPASLGCNVDSDYV